MDSLSIIKETLLFVVLVLLQILLFSRIIVFGVALPLVYIYYLIKLPIGRNHLFVVIISFIMGAIIDLFMNTPGVNATALTIVGVLRGIILNLFYVKIELEGYIPSIYSFTSAFIKYVFSMVVIHQVVLFLVDSLALHDLPTTLVRIGASSVLTLIIIFTIDALSSKNTKTIG